MNARVASLLFAVLLTGCTSNKEITSDPFPDLGTASWLSLASCMALGECDNQYLVNLDSMRMYSDDVVTFKGWNNDQLFDAAINCRSEAIYSYDPSVNSESSPTSSRVRFSWVSNYRSSEGHPLADVLCRFTNSRANHGMTIANANLWNAPGPEVHANLLKEEWKLFEQAVESDHFAPYIQYFNSGVKSDGRTVLFAVYKRYVPRKGFFSRVGDWLSSSRPGEHENPNALYGIYTWYRLDCATGSRSIFRSLANDSNSVNPLIPVGFWTLINNSFTFPNDISSHLRRYHCSRPNAPLAPYRQMPSPPPRLVRD